MPTTTGYEFGDVVLVPFPFTDQTAAKQRPAVVVSSDTYHRERRDLMAITSQLRANGVGEATIQDWSNAGLLRPSVIKPLLATVESSLIKRKLGRLQAEDLRRLRELLDSILGN